MPIEREQMDFDIVIVGAGPAGLSTAIRCAQLAKDKSQPLSICVLEKAAYLGGHSVSGAVLQPDSLFDLIPDAIEKGAPLKTPVTEDQFLFLTSKSAFKLPTPASMKNQGNYIIDIKALCQWLGEQAEALGVNIFPGYAASKLLMENECVVGIQTDDKGLNKDGNPSSRFTPGINIRAKHTVLAEGCRGSLSEEIIHRFNLRANAQSQTYGIGIKEIWKVNAKHHQTGKVIHTVGWPLDTKTYGGSFIYHANDNLIYLGLVIGLDYQNPFLDPFKELQRFKHHPSIKPLLEGGECITYQARALNEGGFQSIPQLTFPGGILVGCAAGFVNVAKIKGIHNAIRSGIIAAESIVNNVDYDNAIRSSSISKELKAARNIRAAFHKGLYAGLAYAALDQMILRGKAPWTFRYKPDNLSLTKANLSPQITYPAPDGLISFNKMTQVNRSNVRHDENQPCHLKLKDYAIPIDYNFKYFDAPEQRYCPAGVYEIITDAHQPPRLQINASNCIHCKTCDIKDPKQNIVWTTPEGGDGPNY